MGEVIEQENAIQGIEFVDCTTDTLKMYVCRSNPVYEAALVYMVITDCYKRMQSILLNREQAALLRDRLNEFLQEPVT